LYLFPLLDKLKGKKGDEKMTRVPKFVLVSLLLLAASCDQQTKQPEQAMYTQTGKAKPIVALVPLIDTSKAKVSWNLSEELTSSIHYKLMQKDHLYLIDKEKVNHVVKKIKDTNNPFDLDVSWVKKVFYDYEFIVFMQLLTHEEVFATTPNSVDVKDSPAELSMAVRVRVIDLRGNEPKVVLQEIIKDSHYLPKQFTSANFTQVGWGTDSFDISPVGVAHSQLAKQVATRLEDYILLSMSGPNE
jgi:hypothetical protein